MVVEGLIISIQYLEEKQVKLKAKGVMARLFR
jgi:hypothetical protein